MVGGMLWQVLLAAGAAAAAAAAVVLSTGCCRHESVLCPQLAAAVYVITLCCSQLSLVQTGQHLLLWTHRNLTVTGQYLCYPFCTADSTTQDRQNMFNGTLSHTIYWLSMVENDSKAKGKALQQAPHNSS